MRQLAGVAQWQKTWLTFVEIKVPSPCTDFKSKKDELKKKKKKSTQAFWYFEKDSNSVMTHSITRASLWAISHIGD